MYDHYPHLFSHFIQFLHLNPPDAIFPDLLTVIRNTKVQHNANQSQQNPKQSPEPKTEPKQSPAPWQSPNRAQSPASASPLSISALLYLRPNKDLTKFGFSEAG